MRNSIDKTQAFCYYAIIPFKTKTKTKKSKTMSAPTMNQAPKPPLDPALDPELEQWAQQVEAELGLPVGGHEQVVASEQELHTGPEVDPATGEIKTDEAKVATTGLGAASRARPGRRGGSRATGSSGRTASGAGRRGASAGSTSTSAPTPASASQPAPASSANTAPNPAEADPAPAPVTPATETGTAGTIITGTGENTATTEPAQPAAPEPVRSWNPNSMVADGLRPKGPGLRERLAASKQRRADKRAAQAATPSQVGTAAASSGQSWSANSMVAAGVRPKGPSMKERFVASRQRRAEKRAAQASNPAQANVVTGGSGQTWSPDSLVAAGVKERTPKDPDAPVLKTPKIDALDLTRDPDAPRPTAAEAAQAMANANRSNIDKLDITTGRDFSAVPPKPSRWAPPAGTTPPPAAPGSV